MAETATTTTELARESELLRSLHVPGDPLVLANAWDAASARAVAAAGFPVVGTSSAGVAASIGREDHEGAPLGEMLDAAERICRSVSVPVTVDAEAGYGLEPAELVGALQSIGAAGCNLEDSDHAAGGLRDLPAHAAWLAAVKLAAAERDYPLVLNARVDTFLARIREPVSQLDLVEEALERARAYLGAGADCVFPIALWDEEALGTFIPRVHGPVNVLALERAPSLPVLAELGAARVSYASVLFGQTMSAFERSLDGIKAVSRGRRG